MGSKWGFPRKLAAGYMVVVFLFLGIVGTSMYAMHLVVNDKDEIISEQTKDIRIVHKISYSFEAKVAGLRGILISGQIDAHLERYEFSRQNMVNHLNELLAREKNVDDKELIKQILEREVSHEQASVRLIRMRRVQHLSGVERHFEDEVLPIREEIDYLISSLLSSKESSLDQHVAQSQGLVRKVNAVVISCGLLTFLIMGVLGQMLRNIFHERSLLLERESVARKNAEMLAGQLQSAQEDERLRISREIHDELGQLLTAIKFQMFNLKTVLDGKLRDAVEAIIKTIDSSIRSARQLASDLRPTALEDLGLEAGLEWWCKHYTERTGLRINLDFRCGPTGKKISTSIFRIVQEAVTNALRHAKTESVDIQIIENEKGIYAIVKDYGIGIDSNYLEKSKKSLGILGMKERARSFGGEVTLSSKLHQGTCVEAFIPKVQGASYDQNSYC